MKQSKKKLYHEPIRLVTVMINGITLKTDPNFPAAMQQWKKDHPQRGDLCRSAADIQNVKEIAPGQGGSIKKVLLISIMVIFLATMMQPTNIVAEGATMTVEEVRLIFQEMTTYDVIEWAELHSSYGVMNHELRSLFLAELQSRCDFVAGSLVRLGYHNIAGMFIAYTEPELEKFKIELAAIQTALKKLKKLPEEQEQRTKPSELTRLFLFPHRLATHEMQMYMRNHLATIFSNIEYKFIP